MTEEEAIRDALIRANKLGAKGIEVTDFGRPTSATQEYKFALATQIPWPGNATGRAWWD